MGEQYKDGAQKLMDDQDFISFVQALNYLCKDMITASQDIKTFVPICLTVATCISHEQSQVRMKMLLRQLQQLFKSMDELKNVMVGEQDIFV